MSKFIADFHLHSKYSRATSRQMDIPNIAKWAKIKGVDLVAAPDWTHPKWLEELKRDLKPLDNGLFEHNKTKFILITEISSIYKKNNKVRKIHNLIFAPSFEIVDKINSQLDKNFNLKSDGRPILGLDAKNLLEIILTISKDCLMVPAHCLLPNTYLHSNPGIKKIKNISVGNQVYTHQGRLKKVTKIYNRFYKGSIYDIRPYYFRIGLQTTDEHPFYVIKTHKNCPNRGSFCAPNCAYIKRRSCPHRYFENYQPQWIQAKDVEKGDVLVFPRFNNTTKDVKKIRLSDYLPKAQLKVFQGKIACSQGRTDKKLPNIVKVDKAFCRLIGYYISEGYTDNRDSISFCFKRNERKYIRDLKLLMKKNFGLFSPRIYKRKNVDSIEIIYFSKILAKVFSKLFYNRPDIKKAHTKHLSFWFLNLPLRKQVEIFKGWWRGDAGYTSSRELMNQMKIICLRLGIIPSIGFLHTKEDFNKGKHKIENRIINARYDHLHFSNLSFFEDHFNLLQESNFRKFRTKLPWRHGWIDKKYIYIPVRDIKIKNYEGEVYNLGIDDDNSYVAEFATVHNCWTPWFSLFGSHSGFDSIEECFEEYSKHIYAIETGLSSDPKMNWRLSALDKITLISNSDAHSPSKLGREANIFNCQLNYKSIINAIKNNKIIKTLEFFPEEGKYHFDGHRACNVCLSPAETRKLKGICPKCGKPLTVGVMHRIDDLADRPAGAGFKPGLYKNLIPLIEIIAEALKFGVNTKAVNQEYEKLIKNFKTEFNVLLDAKIENLERIAEPMVSLGIKRVREGKVHIEPGYDGEYGRISIFSSRDEEFDKQRSLF